MFGSAQGAVLGDVGDDVAAAAGLFEPVEHGPQVAALARPAARRERGAADVEADRDDVAVAPDDVGRPLRVLERGGAEVDARGAATRAPPRACASSRMPPESSTCTPLTCLMTLRRMPALLPRPNAASRSTRWIHCAPCRAHVEGRVDGVAVARLGAGLALGEPDGLPVGDVDGGEQNQFGPGGEVSS